MTPPPQPHTLEEELDQIIDLMRRQDAVRIRRQFRAYTGPIEDFKINDLVYAAVLPPVGNSRKLNISWSGPLQITEIINQAMVRIKELNVNKPRIYDAHISKLRLAKKMGERDTNPIFILPRLPKEDMLQLADELSEINFPCKVNDDLVDEFYEDINHGSQHHDDESSTGQIRSSTGKNSVSNKTEPIRSNTRINNSNSSNSTERRSQASEEDLQEEESEEDQDLYQSFIDSDQSINQSINKAPEQQTEHSGGEDITKILQDEDETITEDQLSSTASEEEEAQGIDEDQVTSAASEEESQRIEPEKQKEARPELRIIENTAPSTATESSGSGTRRSGRITKPVEKYDPSPRPRTPRSRARPGVPKSLRRSGSSIVKTIKSALNEAWENTPQRMGPPPIRTRSRSRETRAASLEKLNQPGSIKINKSLCVDKKSRYSVGNRSASRQGSREVEGESSSWTDSEDDIDERKEGGIHVIGKRKILIAKVEKTVVIQPRQGKWIPVSVDNLNRKNKDDFLIPVLLNTIIERNLVVSKFSPQAGALRSPSMYMINNNDIFMQVRKGETLARLVSLEMRGGDEAENGPERTREREMQHFL